MPELPDIALYLHALEPRVVGRRVTALRLANPFLLRSIDPPLSAAVNRTVVALRRIGKRIVFETEGELFLVFHLMIAGRFPVETTGGEDPGQGRSARARLRARHADSHGGRDEAAGISLRRC